MKKRLFILLLTTALLIGLLTILPVHSESEIYERVLRLHVIANSDSQEDQSLKLLVRDAILDESQKLLADADTQEQAKAIIEQNVDKLRLVAERTVQKNGYSYPISIEFNKESYPTKSYESCAFPSGEYLSLRIMIGNATGENWWCVLFPPLCLSAASDKESFSSVGITDNQYQIITESKNPKYKIRFKFLESISSLLD